MLHGLGMDPEGFVAASIPYYLFQGTRKLQKFITVYPDGECCFRNRDTGARTCLNQDEDAHDPLAFSVPGDKSVTFILDPAEPYFLLSQDARADLMEAMEDAYEEARDRAQAREEGAALLYVTHSLALAERADAVACLLVQHGARKLPRGG